MRLISVDTGSVIKQEPGGAVVRGTDDRTGDLVTFTADLLNARLIEQGTMTLYQVEDADIISVEHTSGQWDSPGTSPEEV